jgi:hypothetical protein
LGPIPNPQSPIPISHKTEAQYEKNYFIYNLFRKYLVFILF